MGREDCFCAPSSVVCETHINTWTFVSSLTSWAVLLLRTEEVPSFCHLPDSCVIEGLNAYYFFCSPFQLPIKRVWFGVLFCFFVAVTMQDALSRCNYGSIIVLA